jgi:hypothetical protein
VHSVVAITSPMYSGGDRRKSTSAVGGHDRRQLHLLGAYRLQDGLWSPLIVAGPSIAKVIAGRVEQGPRAPVPVRQHEGHRRAHHPSRAHDEHADVQPGKPRARRDTAAGIRGFRRSAALLNIVIKPEMVEILVAGDPGRNQSRAYMSNHVQGPPTSRRIDLPAKWEALLKSNRR